MCCASVMGPQNYLLKEWIGDHYRLTLINYYLMTPYGPWILVIIGSGNDMLPDAHQAIPWTNADLLSIRPKETNLSRI